MTFASTTSVDTPVQASPLATEMCGCGAWIIMPEDGGGQVAELLSAFRREHRCLPAGEPVSDDDGVSEDTGQMAPAPVPSEDPRPTTVTGTMVPSQKALGFS